LLPFVNLKRFLFVIMAAKQVRLNLLQKENKIDR
jgi:hypothetical protein